MSEETRKEGIIPGLPVTLESRLLSLLKGTDKVILEGVELELGELELFLPLNLNGPQVLHQSVEKALPQKERHFPDSLVDMQFLPVQEKYPGRVREVLLGATAKNGGTRSHSVTIGGSTSTALSSLANPYSNPPLISLDVFDMHVPLPRALRANIEDVMDDPGEWAKRNVEKFGADLVTIHLMSTDPLISDTSPRSASETVECILSAVKVPVIVGGCGDPKKDALVFSEIAEMASGERLLFNSVTLEMAEARTLEPLIEKVKEHEHTVLGFTGLDLNRAKELNRRLYDSLSPDQIVMDLTTVALGYGLEYSFTIHERARLLALIGDTELQHPTISASTNAWSAREAWMKMDPLYGDTAIRGPLWETVNVCTLLLAGVDLFLMMHPAAISTVREIVNSYKQGISKVPAHIYDWTGMKT